ncbi:hypothetical protein JOQ06_001559 [Pogonophryne albipinna]|uniref:DDE Tnp4 domain-containing protein n=1 Tax=Pogonophryne albipinna TaxID=1090488 RepID=A0AAD6B485_9TELE|nr:hypothetical protein JOQ06_001559 [Pogonophryne albipinna]
MTSPFVELEARIVKGALRRERIFRERINPLDFPEEYLYERYRSHDLTGLAESFVVFPGTCPTQTIKEGFHSMAGFPMVLGCIDCTHVPISASLGDNEGDYVNRKSIHSLNIQATCDHRCVITSLEAKWPGLFIGVLLGDRGYACQPFLMTPYPDPGEGPQTSFNVAHAKTRVRIEMTFGILKARFTCLRGLRVAPERAAVRDAIK